MLMKNNISILANKAFQSAQDLARSPTFNKAVSNVAGGLSVITAPFMLFALGGPAGLSVAVPAACMTVILVDVSLSCRQRALQYS